MKEEKTVTTYCGICEHSCGMKVRVKANEILSIEGLQEHVFSNGNLCPKGMAAKDLVTHPERLTSPLKKESNGWKEITWDEALSICAERLLEIKEKFSPKSLIIYLGHTYVQAALSLYNVKKFSLLYGTPNFCSALSECFAPILLSNIFTFGALTMPELKESKCILIWGSNPMASGAPLVGSFSKVASLFNKLKNNGTMNPAVCLVNKAPERLRAR